MANRRHAPVMVRFSCWVSVFRLFSTQRWVKKGRTQQFLEFMHVYERGRLYARGKRKIHQWRELACVREGLGLRRGPIWRTGSSADTRDSHFCIRQRSKTNNTPNALTHTHFMHAIPHRAVLTWGCEPWCQVNFTDPSKLGVCSRTHIIQTADRSY